MKRLHEGWWLTYRLKTKVQLAVIESVDCWQSQGFLLDVKMPERVCNAIAGRVKEVMGDGATER